MLSEWPDVLAALHSPDLSVVPRDPHSGPAGRLQQRMARFSDGVSHAQRRAAVEDVLRGLPALNTHAHDLAAAWLAAASTPCDAMELARVVPVAVLAAAVGIPSADRDHAVVLTGQLAAGLGALGPGADADSTADSAADELVALVRLHLACNEEWTVALVSVLFQSYAATAALIGMTLLHGNDGDPAAACVEETLRDCSPVRSTRRVAIRDAHIGSKEILTGETVELDLSHAGRARTLPPPTFGTGLHACPGSAQAREIAAGVVTAVRDGGWVVLRNSEIVPDPRPNLNCPLTLPMERLPGHGVTSPRNGRRSDSH